MTDFTQRIRTEWSNGYIFEFLLEFEKEELEEEDVGYPVGDHEGDSVHVGESLGQIDHFSSQWMCEANITRTLVHEIIKKEQ